MFDSKLLQMFQLWSLATKDIVTHIQLYCENTYNVPGLTEQAAALALSHKSFEIHRLNEMFRHECDSCNHNRVLLSMHILSDNSPRTDALYYMPFTARQPSLRQVNTKCVHHVKK